MLVGMRRAYDLGSLGSKEVPYGWTVDPPLRGLPV
jgi:hypothetical protein